MTYANYHWMHPNHREEERSAVAVTRVAIYSKMCLFSRGRNPNLRGESEKLKQGQSFSFSVAEENSRLETLVPVRQILAIIIGSLNIITRQRKPISHTDRTINR